MAWSQNVIENLLKHTVGQSGDYSTGGERYLHLWTVVCDQSGAGGTPLASTWYTEKPLSTSMGTVGSGVQQVANSAAISFTTAAPSTGSIGGWSINTSTDPTVGVLQVHSYAQARRVSTGASVSVSTGALIVKTTG